MGPLFSLSLLSSVGGRGGVGPCGGRKGKKLHLVPVIGRNRDPKVYKPQLERHTLNKMFTV